MSSNFERALAFVLSQEGGWTEDTGGPTRYGISQNAHPDEDITNMTLERAAEIYREQYWDRLGLDNVPWPVSLVVMDTAVNVGVRAAGRMLQQSINDLLNRPALKKDGIVGPATHRKLEEFRGKDACCLAARVAENRAAFYAILAASDKYKPYLRGWVLRCARLQSEIAKGWAESA